MTVPVPQTPDALPAPPAAPVSPAPARCVVGFTCEDHAAVIVGQAVDSARTDENASESSRRWHLLPVGIERWLFPSSFVVAFVVLFVGSWRPALSFDESATVVVVRRSMSQVMRVASFDSALEPYYVVMKLWSYVSTSVLWLRLPSVIAVAAAIAIVVVVIRVLLDLPTALLTGVALLAMPLISRWGQDARPYAFTLLAVVIATAFYLRFSQHGRIWDGVGMGLFLAAAGLMHSYSLTIVAAWFVAALIAPVGKRDRSMLRICVPSAISITILSPYLWFVAQHAKGQPNVAAVSFGSILDTALQTPAGQLNTLTKLFVAILVGLVLIGFVVGWRAGPNGKMVTVLAACWLIVPPMVLITFQLITNSPALVVRYWALCLPGLAILTAIGLRALSRKSWIAAIGCLIVLVLLGVPTQLAFRGVDGHSGAQYAALPRLLSQQSVDSLPIWIGPWWRSLEAVAPGVVAVRAPLVEDPAASGRIHPLILGTDTLTFQQLVTQSPGLIAYPGLVRQVGIPAARQFADFVSFAPVAKVFSQPWVRCNYYGNGLAVFAQPDRTSQLAPAPQMAAQIMNAAPGHVTCVTG